MLLLKHSRHARRLSLVIGGEGENNDRFEELAEKPTNPANRFEPTSAAPAPSEPVGANGQASDTAQITHELARRKGFEKGYQEGSEAGYLKGLEEGKAAGQQTLRDELEKKHAQLDTLLNTLTRPLEALHEDMVESLTEGSLNLAQVLVGAALEADPTALSGVVHDIVKEAQEAGAPNHVLRLQVPSNSYAAIKALAEPHGAEVSVDENLGAGDVLAELSRVNGDPVQRIEWDARLNTRWDAIRKTLKR